MIRSRLSDNNSDVEVLIHLASASRRNKMCAAICESVLRERGLTEIPIVRDVLFIIQSGRIAAPAQLVALQDLSESRDAEYWTKRNALEKRHHGVGGGTIESIRREAAATETLSRERAAINALHIAAEGMTIENIGEAVYEALCATDDCPRLKELVKSMLR